VKKLSRKKRPLPGLMLTSLLDMFTIILIFLIVSFEAESYDFRLNPDLELPESTARSIFRPAVNLAVTNEGVIVEQQPILTLVNGKARDADYELGYVPELVSHLQALYAQRTAGLAEIAPGSETGDEDDGTIVVLQADKDMDYRTLYLIMRSASQAGFTKHRLAVMKR
jgi:biopolymer transport protein ExbD